MWGSRLTGDRPPWEGTARIPLLEDFLLKMPWQQASIQENAIHWPLAAVLETPAPRELGPGKSLKWNRWSSSLVLRCLLGCHGNVPQGIRMSCLHVHQDTVWGQGLAPLPFCGAQM